MRQVEMSAINLITLTLAKLTPLLLAALGGLFSELSGVINFALEAMMLSGAFGAVWASSLYGSPWVGLGAGAVAGMLIALLHAVVCLRFRANQIVSSIALNLLAAGLTGMLLNEVFRVYGTSPAVATLPKLSQVMRPVVPWLESGWVALQELSILVPLALGLGASVMVLFRHTVFGLRIRACGENPQAAEAAGISPGLIRFSAILVGGALAGMGGAYLAIGELSQFVENMTHGRGYLAIAALILGRWKPMGVLLATLLFGFSEALAEALAVTWSQFPAQAFLAFPYVVCLLVLVAWRGKGQPPSSLGH
jgi:general nucleoside transport system permease protein